MAELRTDVGLKAVKRRTKYDFSMIKAGSSLHVATSGERNRLLAAFKYWAKNTQKKGAWATSRKVGADDPDGIGFRVWFMRERDKPEDIVFGGKVDDEI